MQYILHNSLSQYYILSFNNKLFKESFKSSNKQCSNKLYNINTILIYYILNINILILTLT